MLGRVIQCDESGFFIEKGFVFAEDYRVEYDEVTLADAGQVRPDFERKAACTRRGGLLLEGAAEERARVSASRSG